MSLNEAPSLANILNGALGQTTGTTIEQEQSVTNGTTLRKEPLHRHSGATTMDGGSTGREAVPPGTNAGAVSSASRNPGFEKNIGR
jgi:hypothetical protein